jgi:hypothetical protein
MIAGRDRILTPVRCRGKTNGVECGWRATLTKQPLEYKRAPKCKRCGKTITYIDFNRIRKWWKNKPCNCGGYTFPHRRGDGYCEHNPKLTAEDLRLRVEGGPSNYGTDDADVPF